MELQKGGIYQWQDAQHQFVATDQQQRDLPAPPVVRGMAVIAESMAIARLIRREAGTALVGVEGLAEAVVQGRDGRVQVLQFHIHLLKWCH